jgi:transcriptional regulator with XRE-family HTH domain
MDLSKTGLFISTLRKEKDMTQKDLAERIGITDKAVSRWETGKGFPDVSLLVSIADTLGVSVSEVVAGERIEIKEERAVAIMDKTIIDTLGYSQREINKSMVWKNIVIIIVSGAASVVLLSGSLGYFLDADTLRVMLMFFFAPIGLPVLFSLFTRNSPSERLRKFLWISPIIVLVVAVLIAWAYNPYFFNGLFDGYQDGSRSRYYAMVFFLPCLTSVMVTAICYAAKRLIERQKRRCGIPRRPQ